MYFKTLDKAECCGCTACFAACPKRCITMRSDEEGFLYPEIDKEACIECGLCERVCPFDRPTYANTSAPQVYASYVKDENQQVQSSSGGLFYAVSRWVIGQGGIVYGAAFDELFRLRHTGAETLEELRPLRGSKYLQSDLRDTFREIRAHLKAGRWVYFTGTGCQVAGLKAFLQREHATLVTSDLVCHGTPSQQLFDWHLDYLRQKEKGEITFYSFRDIGGWGVCETYNYVSQTRHKSGVRRLYSYNLSPYLYQFMQAFGYRYSCYHCPFARIPRQGDITLADYWGVKRYFPNMDTDKGVSLVLLNSPQGAAVWQEVENTLHSCPSCVEHAAAENGNLLRPTRMPAIRPHCYDMIHRRGYRSVARKEFRPPHYYLTRLRGFLAQTKLGALLKRVKRRQGR